MVKYGYVKFSETGDRWDAPFHLLRMEVDAVAKDLERTIRIEDVMDRLNAVPLRLKSALLPLGQGQTPRALTQRTIDVIQLKYPYLCLAILVRDGEQSMTLLAEEIKAHRQSIKVLEQAIFTIDELSAPSPSITPQKDERDEAARSKPAQSEMRLRQGWIYPLNDPDRYWDEDDAETYGIDPDKRYSYVRIPTGSDPGTPYVLDVWIVDDEGNTHPGHDACPIPILVEDFSIEMGRHLAGETRKPKSIFDSPWFAG